MIDYVILPKSVFPIEDNPTMPFNVARKIVANLKLRQKRDQHYKRKIKEISLTENDLLKIYENQKGRCYWSNIFMDTGYNLISKHPLAISVDRLDNKLGYTTENVVLTLRLFNLGRSDFSSKDFSRLVAHLKEEMKNG